MKFVFIPVGDGYKTHENIDPDDYSLSDDAEIFDSSEAFKERIEEFEA